MITMSLPSSDMFYGTSRLNVYRNLGIEAPMSDVAIATGGSAGDCEEYDNSLKERNGWFWLKEAVDRYSFEAHMIRCDGSVGRSNINSAFIGIRPILQFSSIDELKSKVICGELKDCGDGIKKGSIFLPLYVEKEKQEELMKLLKSGKLKPLQGVSFPTYFKREYKEPYKIKNNRYFEYDGEIYLLLNFSCNRTGCDRLSNGKYYSGGEYIFIKVEEKNLYVDEEKKEAYFDTILSAGVPLKETGSYPEDFNNTDIAKYLRLYCEQFLNLQKVARKIKAKTQRGSDTSTKNKNTDIEIDSMAEELGAYFSKMCKANGLNDADEINKICRQLEEDIRRRTSYRK